MDRLLMNLHSDMGDWIEVVALDEVQQLGSRVIKTDIMKIAVLLTARDEVFAVKDECPHKRVHYHKALCISYLSFA